MYELRTVHKNWQHPKDGNGRFIPLFGDSYSDLSAKWDEEKEMWKKGYKLDWIFNENTLDYDSKYEPMSWEDYSLSFEELVDSERPIKDHYMPDWTPEEKTHFQMYETVSEGTPISPVMETIEQLAQWLADNFPSSFTGLKTSYDQ